MNFLDQIYFNNTVRSYCIVFCIIIFILIFKRYLSKSIANLLFRLAKRGFKKITKSDFINLIVEPIEWFLFILISIIALDKLNCPVELEYKLYGFSFEEIIDKIGKGIIAFSFIWLILRVIDFIALVLVQSAFETQYRKDDQLISFSKDFLKVLVAIGGILLILKVCFNQPISSLLASFSIVGAVLALAAKESLENLIASFVIFFDKPFTTGDTLKVNTINGTVEHIGLRSTRIRTLDKTLVTVPNKQMVDSIVDNWTMRSNRRAEIKIELAPQNSTQQIKNCIQKIEEYLTTKSNFFTSSSVILTEINKNASILTVEFFTEVNSLEYFLQIKEDINLGIKKIIDDNQFTKALPSNDLTNVKEG